MPVPRNTTPAIGSTFAFSEVSLDDRRASLRAAGELDLAAVRDLTLLLAGHQRAGRVFVQLDMAAVTFMDCSCLNVLVRTHQELRNARGQLVLTSVRPTVARVFAALDPADALLVASDLAPILRTVTGTDGPGPQRDGRSR